MPSAKLEPLAKEPLAKEPLAKEPLAKKKPGKDPMKLTNKLRLALRQTDEKLKASERQIRELSQRADVRPERVSELLEAEKKVLAAKQEILAAQRKSLDYEDRNQKLVGHAEKLLHSNEKAAIKIKALQAENARLKQSHEFVGDTIDGIKNELKGMREKSETIKSEWSKAEQNAANLSAELASVHSEKHSLTSQLDRQVDRASTAESETAAERDKNLELQAAMSELQSQKSLSETHIEQQQRLIDSLNIEIDQRDKVLSTAMRDNKRLIEELDSHQKNQTLLQTELDKAKNSLADTNERMASSERVFVTTQNQLSKVDLEVITLKQQLKDATAEKNVASDLARQLQGTLNDKLEEAKSLQTELKQAKQDVAALQEVVDKKTDRIRLLEGELGKSELNINGLQQRIDQQVSQLDRMHQMEAELQETKLHSNKLEQSNQQLNEDLNTAHKQSKENRDLYDLAKGEKLKLEQSFKEVNSLRKKDAEQLKKSMQLQNSLMDEHVSSIKEKEQKIIDLESRVRNLGAELDTAKAEGNKEEIARLQLDVTAKNQEIATLQARLAESREQADTLQKQQTESQEQIDILQKQQRESQTEISSLHQKLTATEQNAKQELKTYERQLAAMGEAETTIVKLHTELLEIQSKSSELRGSFQMTAKRLDACNSSLQSFEEKFKELISLVQPVLNMPNVAPLVNDLKIQVKELSSELSALKTEQGHNANKLDSLESRTVLLERSSQTSVTDKREDGQQDPEVASMSLQSKASGAEVPRPAHLVDDSSVRGGLAPSGRLGDGFSSSEDENLRGPDSQHVSGGRV
ncbi:hypothetical protein [Endozoicomonas sp. ONNA2]|uniref:hypothetical protein n=1 Tax=Endozoicomonas sp. ONNA2 TaxID=2828741 RepID=UPI0021477761|nr:hypothetical protein [Endozoicomonas sp. ONNA2]